MKLFSGDTWRHKPGRTAILTYDYLPSNSRVWLSEGYDGSNAILGDIVYDSSIYYILSRALIATLIAILAIIIIRVPSIITNTPIFVLGVVIKKRTQPHGQLLTVVVPRALIL